jgi:hypothetical protein
LTMQLTYPLELIRARITVNIGLPPLLLIVYLYPSDSLSARQSIGIIEATRDVIRLDGFRGLYRGLWPSILVISLYECMCLRSPCMSASRIALL